MRAKSNYDGNVDDSMVDSLDKSVDDTVDDGIMEETVGNMKAFGIRHYIKSHLGTY